MIRPNQQTEEPAMALTPKEIGELAVSAATRAAKAEVEEAAERAAEAAARKCDRLTPEQVGHMVPEAVRQTLLQMGIDTSDPLAMQRDFQHLRDWRESGEAIKKKGTLALVGIFVSGLGTLLFLGLKDFFHLK